MVLLFIKLRRQQNILNNFYCRGKEAAMDSIAKVCNNPIFGFFRHFWLRALLLIFPVADSIFFYAATLMTASLGTMSLKYLLLAFTCCFQPVNRF